MTDAPYQDFPYRFQNGGLVARYVADALPPGTYADLRNLESRAENSLASRYGLSALSTDGTNNFPLTDVGTIVTPQSISRMRGLDTGFRYAKAGTALFRRATDTRGSFNEIYGINTLDIIQAQVIAENVTLILTDPTALLVVGTTFGVQGNSLAEVNGPSFTVLASSPGQVQYQIGVNLFTNGLGGQVILPITDVPMSTARVSMFAYRPNGNAAPYMFIADNAVLLKDNGTLSHTQNMGGSPSFIPPTIQIGDPGKTIIEQFNEVDTSSFTLTNFGSPVINTVRLAFGQSGSVPLPLTPSGIVTIPVPTITAFAFQRTAGVAQITPPIGSLVGQQLGLKISVQNCPDPSFNVSAAVITLLTGAFTKSFSYVNPGPDVVSTPGGTTTVGIMPSIIPGMLMQIGDAAGFANPETLYVLTVGASSFTAKLTIARLGGFTVVANVLSGTVASNTTASVSKHMNTGLGMTGTVPSEDADYIQFGVQISDPLTVTELKIFFDVGDGTFTQDYYYKAIEPSGYQPGVTGQIPSRQMQTNRVADRAAAAVDLRTLGVPVTELAPPDLPDIVQLRAVELNTGKAAWSTIQVKLSEFVPVGLAGGINNNWSNVVAWKLQIVSAPNVGTTVGISSMALIGGAGLDSYGEQSYDYRYTYYNIATDYETNPTLELADAFFLAPRRQPIAVTYFQPTDTQFTHVRIYRRGGTLTQAWYRVATVPCVDNGSAAVYSDSMDDATAEIRSQLQIDNDRPVTSVMRIPVNLTNVTFSASPSVAGSVVTITPAALQTIQNVFVGQLVTVGSVANQEQAFVVSKVGATFTVFLQNSHTNGETVSASTKPTVAMNLMAIAFDKIWLAGDPDNPHVLYFSKPFQPESFPVANSIEVGTPDSPIMFMVAMRGLLYVFTTKTVYQVLGAGSSVPTIIPTGVMHGAVSNFGWAAAESMIFYMSYDGVYVFQGASAPYLSEQTEWIWTGKNLGPVQAIDRSQIAEVFMAYGNHELFISYLDQMGGRHRMIYHDVYRRFRDDDTAVGAITAEFFEQDTGNLIVGKDDGMLYIDRVGDYDSGGFVAGVEIVNAIPVRMESARMDNGSPKAPKVYNELTLDWDTQGQTLDVAMTFDNGTTTLPLGSYSQNGRGQTQININDGLGQVSQNSALVVSGSVTKVISLFEAHIRALVQADQRRSSDGYWQKFGTDEYKLIKQGYFEYVADADVPFSVFADGGSTAIYNFTLPSTNGQRTALRVRFPAEKAKLWRFVSTSTENYQLYDECSLDVKPIGGPKGYSSQKLPT